MGIQIQILVADAYAAIEKGKISEAIQILEKAITATPQNADLYAYLGEAYFLNQEYIHAQEVFLKHESLSNHKTNTFTPYITGYRGCILIAEGKIAEGQSLLEQAIQENAQEPHFYYSLAKAYFLQNKQTIAYEFMGKIEQLDPCFYYRKIQQLINQI